MGAQTQALLGVVVIVAAAVYLLPSTIALTRHAEARVEIVALNLLLGWTGAVWVAALLLALGPRAPRRRSRAQPAELPAKRGPVYLDGWYVLSSGPESSTWAVCQGGRWRIVYEMEGRQRLVGTVPEHDVPVAVRADALIGAEDGR